MTTVTGSESSGSQNPPQGRERLSERQGRVLGLVARRIVQIPLVLLFVSMLTYWLIQVVPGDPGRESLGQYATPAQVHQFDAANGLTGALTTRYLNWLHGFITGHWGTSIVFSEANRGLVLSHLVNSALLGALGFLLLVPLSVVLGAIQAYREGRRTDRTITISLMSLSAVPPFVLGVLVLLVFAVWVHLVPVQGTSDAMGDVWQRLHAMIGPAVVLVFTYVAVVTRMVRTGTAGAITAPYHRTAVLKGLAPADIVRRHVLRNATVPTLSLLGLYLGSLLCGDAVVETLFNYPGLGALLVTAAEHKDIVLLSDGVIVTGAVALLALLVADIGLILADPRIRFDNADR